MAPSKKKKRIDEVADVTFKALQINIEAQSARTALTLREYIETQKALGVADDVLEQALLEDLSTGGRIFGEFNRSLGLNLQGRMGQLANQASDIEFGEDPDEQMIWIAALVNTCPDCLPRHGEVDTRANWEIRGEPRTGWSVCRLNCQCQLLPASDAKDQPSLKEPLKRER